MEKEQKKVDMERKEDNRTASVRQVVEKQAKKLEDHLPIIV